nr:dynein intermediate chain 1, axonemal-like isoform X1 [Lepeophtheirus salmonis]
MATKVETRSKKMFGGNTLKKASSNSNTAGDDAHGILEGISSLHSWIKTQTMIRPSTKSTKGKGGATGGNVLAVKEDLDEEVVISLNAKDPLAPTDLVRFDYTIGAFIQIKLVEKMIDHLDIESTCVHKSSPEGCHQLKLGGVNAVGIKGFKGLANKVKVEKIILRHVQKPKVIEDYDDDDEEDSDEDVQDKKKVESNKSIPPKKSSRRRDSALSDDDQSEKKLTNQFSFVERATQTMNDSQRNQDVQTEPPPRSNFSDTVNQWVIYDAYIAYEKAKEAQEEKEKTKNKEEKGSKTAPALKKLLDLEPSSDPNDKVNKKLFKAAKILERMVNQNTYNDIALDFKYWEDASDEFREHEGTLLPLWKFYFEKAKNLEITSLCWNPCFNDMFAAAYGSYDFYAKDDFGVICIFSLKNPSYPEYLCISDSSVMTVDIHVDHPHMVVTGRADGNVAVYNLQLDNPQHPSYISSAQNGKHRDIVWHVKWAKDNLDGYLNFYSISGDGRVTNWTMVKTALWFTDLLKIPFTRQLENFSEVTKHLRDGGRCIAFNPEDDASFLVGTEEGLVYKCTTEYSSKFLMTYQAHNTPLSTIAWNKYVPSIFLTCAAEWMIKMFEQSSSKPLFMFDLNSQVGDIAWAPYSSTVFAAVTVDGKVHIFDLHADKYHPICVQPVVPRKKAKLNHVSFNPYHPILIVGDSRGYIQCLKLSPNLRKQTKDIRMAFSNKDAKKALELEKKKLESLLAMVKDTSDSIHKAHQNN